MLPTLNYDDDYPTLRLFVQQSGFSYDNSSDFITTDLRGGAARINVDILNGWYTANVKVLIRDNTDAAYWQDFYSAPYDGLNGGIERVMPFFFEGLIDGVYGKHLCQILKSSYKHSNFRWQTKDITLQVQIRPPENTDPCYKEGDMISLYNCGYQSGEDKKLNDTANAGFDPFNKW